MNDTHPSIAALQLELMRKASPQKRLELMQSFSSELIALSRKSLAARLGDEREVKLEWVRINYGADVAERIRKYLYATA